MYEDNEVTVMASDKDLKRLKLCFSLYNPQKTLTKLLIDQSYAALCDPHAPLSMEFSRQEYLSEFSSVQSLSSVWLFATPWTAAHQAFLSITNSQSPHKPIPLSQWCHPTTSSSVVPFSSCLQSFPASGSTSVKKQQQQNLSGDPEALRCPSDLSPSPNFSLLPRPPPGTPLPGTAFCPFILWLSLVMPLSQGWFHPVPHQEKSPPSIPCAVSNHACNFFFI